MTKIIGREINNKFLYDLGDLSGILHPILCAVKKDRTLSIQIRDGYVNIYYMGGNLLLITQSSNGYVGGMNEKYGLDKSESKVFIKNVIDAENVVKTFEKRKILIEKKSVNKDEKVFQQELFYQNNGGNFIIVDTEIQIPKRISQRLYGERTHYPRFDMVAVVPIGNGEYKVVLIENKYSGKCLDGKSGLKQHAIDYSLFINSDYWGSYVTELEHQISILGKLGIINMPEYFYIDSKKKAEIWFIIGGVDGKIIERCEHIVQRDLKNIPVKFKYFCDGDKYIL